MTVKPIPLLAAPPTVTTTFPVAAPAGTATVILVEVHTEAALAATPLNFTTLLPCVDPKFVPLIDTAPPIGPVKGDNPEIAGAPGTEIVYTAVLT